MRIRTILLAVLILGVSFAGAPMSAMCRNRTLDEPSAKVRLRERGKLVWMTGMGAKRTSLG